MSLAAILLAAGASTRLGFPKQLLKLDSRTLIRRASETLLANSCDPVVVVLGAHAARILPELAGLPITTVHNPDWHNGMASSIQAGLTAIQHLQPHSESVLIALCDQPRVTADDLRALISLFNRAGKSIAASFYHGTLGVPAIFAHSVFPELLALQGEAGARKVFAANLHNVAQLPLPAAALDVDTVADLAGAGVTPEAFD